MCRRTPSFPRVKITSSSIALPSGSCSPSERPVDSRHGCIKKLTSNSIVSGVLVGSEEWTMLNVRQKQIPPLALSCSGVTPLTPRSSAHISRKHPNSIMYVVCHPISDLRHHHNGSKSHQAGSSRTVALPRRQPMAQCQPSVKVSLEEDIPS